MIRIKTETHSCDAGCDDVLVHLLSALVDGAIALRR